MTPRASTPSTYRTSTGAAVAFPDAIRAWGLPAYELLQETAKTYNAFITYPEFAERVQEESGVRTRTAVATWVGRILELIAIQTVHTGEVPLTSLCVKTDGTMGDNYALHPKVEGTVSTDDVEADAAAHRLVCYRKYATDLPEDGGEPTFPPKEAARRERAARKAEREARSVKTPDVVRPICPSCFTELPANGHCWRCE